MARHKLVYFKKPLDGVLEWHHTKIPSEQEAARGFWLDANDEFTSVPTEYEWWVAPAQVIGVRMIRE